MTRAWKIILFTAILGIACLAIFISSGLAARPQMPPEWNRVRLGMTHEQLVATIPDYNDDLRALKGGDFFIRKFLTANSDYRWTLIAMYDQNGKSEALWASMSHDHGFYPDRHQVDLGQIETTHPSVIFDYLQHLPGSIQMLVVGVAIAATCSLLSTYVVLRKMALISEGVSHAGFGGLAVALVVGYFIPALGNEVAIRFVTGIFCLGTALLIGFFARSHRVHEDSAIGILLVASVALGNILLHYYVNLPHKEPVRTNVEKLLFGDFASVNVYDMITSVTTAAICFLIVGLLYWQFLYTTLDEEMARVNGVNTRLINLLLMTMISLVIVINVRMVGFLMITAMTIIPGATANMISRKFSGVLAISIGLGTIGTVGALLLVSNNESLSEYPSGPFIVLALFAVFTITWVFRRYYKPKPVALPQDHAH